MLGTLRGQLSLSQNYLHKSWSSNLMQNQMKPFTEFRPGILEETVINKVDVKTNLLTEKVMYLAMCCKIIYNNNFYFYFF